MPTFTDAYPTSALDYGDPVDEFSTLSTSGGIVAMVGPITQAAYDALTPVAGTVYYIVG